MKFRHGWLSAGAAGLLLATGCQQRDQGTQPSTGQTVDQAQERSAKALGSAQREQENAQDQRKESVEARQDVTKKQQDLQQAQAKAQQESQQAQQAQQQANQASQQASGSTASATGAVAGAGTTATQQGQQGGTQQISGDVLTANDTEVLVSSRGEPQMRLQIGPQTQVTVDGRQAGGSDIREGSQVRASFTQDETGEPRAIRIDATTRTQPLSPAAPNSGESTPGGSTRQPSP